MPCADRVTVLQVARTRLTQLSKACISAARVAPPNPPSSMYTSRRVHCPEARLINFNVLLKNFRVVPPPSVLARARRFIRRQLQPTMSTPAVYKGPVDHNCVPVLEVKPPVLMTNITQNPFGWALEGAMASAFLKVVSCLDPAGSTLTSLLPALKMNVLQLEADVLNVRRD